MEPVPKDTDKILSCAIFYLVVDMHKCVKINIFISSHKDTMEAKFSSFFYSLDCVSCRSCQQNEYFVKVKFHVTGSNPLSDASLNCINRI